MSEIQEDGAPLRDHLKSVWRQTGEMPEQLLDATERPELTGYLWDWFCDMNLERETGGMGPGRITARIMLDWCWATGNELVLWERKAIRLIDGIWFASRAEKK